MARIDDALLNSIVYMCYSEAAEPKGSGFITSVIEQGCTHLYAVTNRHLIRDNCTCVQILATGNTLSLTQSHWQVKHGVGPDLAVSLLPQFWL